MSETVRRPKEYEEMMLELCQTKEAIFDTFKDCLVFCACLGAAKGRRRSFERSSEPVGIHVFRDKFDLAIFQILGIFEEKDPAIMSSGSRDARVRIFEEYACGGLDILKERVFDAPDSFHLAFASLLKETQKTGRNILSDITDAIGSP